jgi:hypothetical protein
MILHVALALALETGSAASDTTRDQAHASGAVTVTNNGISLIPSFSLGKPATIIDVGIERASFAFEPQFKLGLDGYPWAFIFWGRYRPRTGDRFHLVIGEHPAVQFHQTTIIIGGVPRNVTTTNRYFVTELWPSVSFTKNVGTGVYWLDGHGLDSDATQHTHFVSWRSSVNVPLSSGAYVFLAPQAYYLWQDRREAEYVNAAATIGRRGLPLALTGMVNRKLQGTLPTKGFLWNVSLTWFLR